MGYYLGLDNGGTSTKAAVFDHTGREIGVSSMDTAMLTPKPGFVERDMEEMWEANCRVIRQVMKKTGITSEQILGVGICGHGKGLYLWGKNNKPVRNGIISTDNRAYEYPLKWQADGTEKKAGEKSCQKIMACQPVALMAWLKDYEPECIENIQWIFGCKDYVRFRMTNQAQAELTDISGSGFLNLHTREYDDELLEFFGLEEIRDALPPLVKATDICGYVTEKAAEESGLRAGTPVIGGMFDIDACALGVGMLQPETLCMIAGTWSINEYIRTTPVLDGSVAMNSLFCLPQYYLIEESSPTSAGNQAWFIRKLLPELSQETKEKNGSIYDILNDWVSKVDIKEQIPTFLPFLMASNVNPRAQGTFVGISVSHTRAHLLRAVYEGIAFSHRYHYEKLLTSLNGKKPEYIRLAGGAAHSQIWAQMFADIMQVPIETVEANETGALGCAIAVAFAVDEYSSLESAAQHMCKVSMRLLPDPDAGKIYDQKYSRYLKAIECLDGFWEE